MGALIRNVADDPARCHLVDDAFETIVPIAVRASLEYLGLGEVSQKREPPGER